MSAILDGIDADRGPPMAMPLGHFGEVGPGDVVVVPAGETRGVKAGDQRLEATLVTALPPMDAEHDPVREGLRTGKFDPRSD